MVWGWGQGTAQSPSKTLLKVWASVQSSLCRGRNLFITESFGSFPARRSGTQCVLHQIQDQQALSQTALWFSNLGPSCFSSSQAVPSCGISPIVCTLSTLLHLGHQPARQADSPTPGMRGAAPPGRATGRSGSLWPLSGAATSRSRQCSHRHLPLQLLPLAWAWPWLPAEMASSGTLPSLPFVSERISLTPADPS